MEWNGKIPLQWDWENLIMFNTTTAENPRKLRQTEWDIDGDGEFDSTSFFSSGGGGGSSGGSGSVLGGFPSLSKSSKSPSNNSSSVGETKTSKINLEALGEIPEGFGTKKELISNSPTLESVGSAEPFLGLKLGKRMYFEDVCGGSGAKSSSFSVNPPSSSVTTAKRSKSSSQNTCAVRCQVEGCGLDLASAKDYHRKHRVCESHSKSSKVIVGGLERRFCQQCSRFHGLSEFDEKKRSCRRRLSDHNARRRKPQPEAVRLNAARLSSSLYGGKQQLSLVWNNVPYLHTKPSENFIWEGTCGKPGKVGGTEGLLHSREGQLQNSVLSHCYDSNGFLLPKAKGTTTAKVIDQGEEGSMISFNLGAAQNDQRALSLLSTNFWGLGEPKQVSNSHAMDANQSNMPQPVIHSIPQVSPFASSEDWRTEKQSTDSQVQSLISHNHESNYAQEIRLSRASYESCFYSSHLN